VGFLVKFSAEDGIVWVNSEINWSTYSIPRKAKLTQGRIALWEGGSTSAQIHLVDTDTGEIVQSQTGWDSQAGNTCSLTPTSRCSSTPTATASTRRGRAAPPGTPSR
jgi:hypothetical protein